MAKLIALPCLLLALLGATTFSAGAMHPGASPATREASPGAAMIADLAALTDHNWARVAGADTGLPPNKNGHDEFVAAWTSRMLSALHDLPTGVFRQPFRSAGFVSAPVTKAAANIVIVVPGSRHPDQAVVVGAHPDGEPWSRGSAFDDASGCAIMLGLARALGTVWRRQGLPALTVEFVLFDAEEQGLDGSVNYAFDLRQGAVMPRPVFMIDEEQSGIGYPARPFGLRSQSPMPSFAITNSPDPLAGLPSRISNLILRGVGTPATTPHAMLTLAAQRVRDAAASTWSALHRAYPSIRFRGGSVAAFGSADRQLLEVGPTPLCCSDNAPFELLGMPTLTLAGNSDYYGSKLPWAYPYDQPEDTLQAMACDTGGSPVPGPALEAALALPMQISQQIIAAYAPPSAGSGLAAFSLPAGAGTAVRLHAYGVSGVTWSFGDGGTASGTSVAHIYKQPGSYRVTAGSTGATSTWRITVAGEVPALAPHPAINPPPRRPWHPAELQGIPGC